MGIDIALGDADIRGQTVCDNHVRMLGNPHHAQQKGKIGEKILQAHHCSPHSKTNCDMCETTLTKKH